MLEYLKKHGIKHVHGEIGLREDVIKVTKFWEINGFIVRKYDKPKGNYVAEISMELQT